MANWEAEDAALLAAELGMLLFARGTGRDGTGRGGAIYLSNCSWPGIAVVFYTLEHTCATALLSSCSISLASTLF